MSGRSRTAPLFYNGYTYQRNKVIGMKIHWRCSDYKKKRCRARVQTVAERIFTVSGHHNHRPINQFVPLVPDHPHPSVAAEDWDEWNQHPPDQTEYMESSSSSASNYDPSSLSSSYMRQPPEGQ